MRQWKGAETMEQERDNGTGERQLKGGETIERGKTIKKFRDNE